MFKQIFCRGAEELSVFKCCIILIFVLLKKCEDYIDDLVMSSYLIQLLFIKVLNYILQQTRGAHRARF